MRCFLYNYCDADAFGGEYSGWGYDLLRVDGTLVICAAFGWGGEEAAERCSRMMDAFTAASSQ